MEFQSTKVTPLEDKSLDSRVAALESARPGVGSVFPVVPILSVGPLGTPHLNKGKQIVGVSDGEKLIPINTNLPAVTVPEPQEYPKAVIVGKDATGTPITKVVHNATEERALPARFENNSAQNASVVNKGDTQGIGSAAGYQQAGQLTSVAPVVNRNVSAGSVAVPEVPESVEGVVSGGVNSPGVTGRYPADTDYQRSGQAPVSGTDYQHQGSAKSSWTPAPPKKA
jgi:hypothetical protein